MTDEIIAAQRAATFALYAIHDLLVDKGLLEQGEAAATLRRFTADDAVLMGMIAGIADNLEERPFKYRHGPDLRVVPSD